MNNIVDRVSLKYSFCIQVETRRSRQSMSSRYSYKLIDGKTETRRGASFYMSNPSVKKTAGKRHHRRLAEIAMVMIHTLGITSLHLGVMVIDR